VIKSLVVPRFVAREDEVEKVKACLLELGFRSGEGWNDERSRGEPLLAPVGALEFFHGQPPAAADVIVEVEDVQRALDIITRHGMKVLCPVARTHWGADLFVAAIGYCHIAFFRWAEEAEAPVPKAA
jgi:hypothetical protein